MADSFIGEAVPCPSGSRLSFSWGMGTELLLISQTPADAAIQENSQGAYLSSVSSTSSAAHRAVAAAVAPAWSKLQQQLYQARDASSNGTFQGALSASLADFSLLVRQQLMKQAAAGSSKSVSIGVEAAAWGLLEILNLHCVQSEGYLAEELAGWLEEHRAALDRALKVQPGLGDQLAQLFDPQGTAPEVQPQYWPCITHLVCVGRITEALELIEAHSAMRQAGTGAAIDSRALSQHQLLDPLHGVLRKMPHFKRSYNLADPAMQARSAGAGRQFDNMAEFEAHRSDWQAEVGGLYQWVQQQPRVEDTTPGVLEVLSVLVGDDRTIAKACSNWLEVAVAQLLHKIPQAQLRQHAAMLVAGMVRQKPIPAEHEEVLGLFSALLKGCGEGEMQEVVNTLVASRYISPWGVAHAYDLLAYAGPRMASVLFRPIPGDGCNQIEVFRLVLAESLMPTAAAAATSSSWQLALHYLTYCPQHGRPAAEAMLQTLPVGSRVAGTHLLRKATAAARELGLSATATSLTRSAAASAWYSGQVGVAVQLLGTSAGAGDAVRAAIALSPLEEHLNAQLAGLEPNYQRPALPQLPELEVQGLHHVLDSCATSSSTGSGITSWLPGYVAVVHALKDLEQCLAAVATSTGQQPEPGQVAQSSTSQQDRQQQLQKAAQKFLQSLVGLTSGSSHDSRQTSGTTGNGLHHAAIVGGPSVSEPLSPGLLLPALAHLIPALELPACAAVCDDEALQKLLAAASSAAASLGASPVTSPAVAARCVQDLQLCLARLACRAHVYASAH